MRAILWAMIYVFWTAADLDEARQISAALVEKKLVACANLIPHIESIYQWEGAIESSSEAKVIFKTLARHYDAISTYISAHCSYAVPEISYIKIEGCHSPYLDWLKLALI